MILQTAKGVKDYNTDEKILRNEIVKTITSIFETYGFNPIETPILERYETLAAKFGAGVASEALKETFKLKDQGKRNLALRFEFTTSLARFIAINPQIKFPFKVYQIGPVFRDGPIKIGRLREFWQLDSDIIGSSSLLADAELIEMTLRIFKELRLNAYLEVNDRNIMNAILDKFNIKNKEDVIITIDKIKKLPLKEIKKELKQKKLSEKTINGLLSILTFKGANDIIINKLKKLGIENEVKKIKELLSYVDKKKVRLNISLARGLSYYTGTVFEGFLANNPISSICAGGRYDDIIGKFSGKEKIPAVGISFGLEPIANALIKNLTTKTQIYIIPIKTLKQSLKIANMLREKNINTDIDLLEKDISKNLDFANKKAIPYVLFIGEKELKLNKVKLRDMKSGKESLLTIPEIVKLFNKREND